MTIPLWCALAFAAWTLLTLGLTVGHHRWSRILTGRARFEDYSEYRIEGAGYYPRGMRAHANCVENLPVFATIVLVLSALGMQSAALDTLAIVVIAARVLQTSVHVGFEQTNTVVTFRSILYNTQWLAMLATIVLIAASQL
jgi:uncharacterized MAPEG superfamily protein